MIDLDKLKFEATIKVMKFVKERGYTYSIEEIVGSYILYVKPQKYYSYSMRDIMENVGIEVKLLSKND